MLWKIFALLLLLLSACSVLDNMASKENMTPDESGKAAPSEIIQPGLGTTPENLALPTGSPPNFIPLPAHPFPREGTLPVPMDVPADLLSAIRSDLERQLGSELNEFEIIVAQSVIWPDGGLGCSTPGMEYIQVLVEGMRIVVKANGVLFEYHSGGRGEMKQCPVMQVEILPQLLQDDQPGTLTGTPVDQ